MRSIVIATALFVTVGTVTTQSAAQPLDTDVNINLHMTQADYSGCATFDDADFVTCDDLASAPPASVDLFVWAAVSREDVFDDGIGGIEFGIFYGDSVLVQGWTLCTGGLEIPMDDPELGTWPASGTGNAMTWFNGCYVPPHEVAKIGFFSLVAFSGGPMQIIPDVRVGQALYVDCDGTLFEICEGNLGGATVPDGSTPTCGNHCGVTPVRETSWGQLKSLF
jgi:hypothetical protein